MYILLTYSLSVLWNAFPNGKVKKNYMSCIKNKLTCIPHETRLSSVVCFVSRHSIILCFHLHPSSTPLHQSASGPCLHSARIAYHSYPGHRWVKISQRCCSAWHRMLLPFSPNIKRMQEFKNSERDYNYTVSTAGKGGGAGYWYCPPPPFLTHPS